MKKNICYLLVSLFLVCIFSTCKSLPEYEMNITKEDSKSLTAEISYPLFSNFPTVNEQVKILVDKWKLKYSQLQTEWDEYDVLHREKSPESETPPFGYSIQTDSVIVNKQYVSVLLRLWWFEGGAHGNTSLASITYDINKNKFVTIEDVSPYSLQELSTLCYNSLCNKIEGSEDFKDWIAGGTSAESIDNFSRFTFDGKMLTIYFEPYQVGPWAIGTQSVQLPVNKN